MAVAVQLPRVLDVVAGEDEVCPLHAGAPIRDLRYQAVTYGVGAAVFVWPHEHSDFVTGSFTAHCEVQKAGLGVDQKDFHVRAARQRGVGGARSIAHRARKEKQRRKGRCGRDRKGLLQGASLGDAGRVRELLHKSLSQIRFVRKPVHELIREGLP